MIASPVLTTNACCDGLQGRWLLLMLAACLAIPTSTEPAMGEDVLEDFDGILELTLHDTIWTGDSDDDRRALMLHVEADEGRWGRIWGMALGYSNGVHQGAVRSAAVTDGHVELEFVMDITGDLWVDERATGAWRVRLERDGEALAGQYTGEFKGREIEGHVTGEVLPPRARKADFRPPRRDEHPRVMFRREDRPALREKFETPFGRAYRRRAEANGDMVSLGMLYQLTGDLDYAAKAQRQAERLVGDIIVGVSGSGGVGHREVELALALDLCRGAWPEALVGRIESELRRELPMMLNHLRISYANHHPVSNYYGPGFGSAAIVALTQYGRPGAQWQPRRAEAQSPSERRSWQSVSPEAPEAPFADATAIAPDSDFEPRGDVPVVALEKGVVPQGWLAAGPVDGSPGRDLLSGIGGYGKARPEAGTTTRVLRLASDGRPRASEITFHFIDEDAITDEGVDIGAVGGRGEDDDSEKQGTKLLYTVLKVEQEKTVVPLGPDDGMQLWLAGKSLEREAYRLTPGHYPLMLVTERGPQEGPIRPRLVSPDDEHLADARVDYDRRMEVWQQRKRDWQRNEHTHPMVMEMIDRGWRLVWRHYRLGIGDGGFQAETGVYALIATRFPLIYASLAPNTLGRVPWTHDDVTHLLPRRMMQCAFGEGGAVSALKLNSVEGLNGRLLAAGLPISPEQYRPALLWAWNHMAGIDKPEDAGRVFEDESLGNGLDLALAFLNYPLDMEPEHPAEVMPKHWHAPTYGFHTWRDGWEGEQSFIGQVFLKSRPIHGWNHPNAATFRLHGLGRAWATGPTTRNGARQLEPVVILPDREHNRSAGGQLKHLEQFEDGSGAMAIDMNDVYSSPGRGRSIDRMLVMAPDQEPDWDGRGLRAIAMDYSGLSGAPALVVLVDRVDVPGEKLWQWPVPDEPSGRPEVTIDGATFGFDYGEENLHATFITPGDIELGQATDHIEEADPRYGYHGPVERVRGEHEGPFFIIATVQRGEAPEVKVEGTGLDAVVTVGERTVRFDGERIILGEVE